MVQNSGSPAAQLSRMPPTGTVPDRPNLTATAVLWFLGVRPATAPPTKPPQISPGSFPIKSVSPSTMRPDLQASTIFPCAGPVPAPPKPAITATAPGPAAPDTPGTMGEA